MQPAGTEITMQKNDERILVHIAVKQMDERHGQALLNAIPPAAKDSSLPVWIDMSDVKFVPSCVIGSLLMLYKALTAQDSKMVLIGLNPQIHETLRICNLTTLFKIAATTEEAKNC